MSEAQRESMNNLTADECLKMYAECGMVTVCGNGEVFGVYRKEQLEDAESSRSQYGY